MNFGKLKNMSPLSEIPENEPAVLKAPPRSSSFCVKCYAEKLKVHSLQKRICTPIPKFKPRNKLNKKASVNLKPIGKFLF